MSKPPSKREQILDVAERMARSGGYDGFSFRQIADQVGIKGASVVYHFPTKQALGEAIAQRYTQRFFAAIGAVDQDDAPIDRFIRVFRHALKVDGQMCLCGLLGAEINALPAPVAAEARNFFNLSVAWLEKAYASATAPRDSALSLLALLEGALIVAQSLDDPEAFERILSASSLANT
ncbi:MAG: hypothetical protein Alpg2KO_08970 [Alphaproteobacteria bacterium]